MVEYKNYRIHNNWEIVYEKDGVIKMNTHGVWINKGWGSFKNSLQEPTLALSPTKLLAIIQIQRLATMQCSIFDQLDKLLSTIPNNITDSFNFIRERYIDRNVKLYDDAQDKIMQSINNDSDYDSIIAIANSYQEMMDVLLKDIINTSLDEEKLEGIKILLDWILNSPSGFAKRLRPFGFKITLPEKEYSYCKTSYVQQEEQSEKTASLLQQILKGVINQWMPKLTLVLFNRYNYGK